MEALRGEGIKQTKQEINRRKMIKIEFRWSLPMRSIGETEEKLAEITKQILGFKPSSKFKRGPIGILIYVVCGVIAFFSLRSAGVF